MRRGNRYLYLLTLLALLLSFIPLTLRAQGDLLVTPLRLVFDGRERVIDVTLANTGNDTSRYQISLINYRMTEDGSMEEIKEPDPGQNFADRALRYFPRSVVLAPGEAQVVKVQARTSGLADGEYRSHLYFRAAVSRDAIALGDEKRSGDTTGLSIRLIPIYGISIPAIIRVGTPTTTVAIENLRLTKGERGGQTVQFSIMREGNSSVYGDIRVIHISPDGRETPIAAVNGIAVYTPGKERKVILPLSEGENLDLTSGRVRLTYEAPTQVRPQRYAEVEIELTR